MGAQIKSAVNIENNIFQFVVVHWVEILSYSRKYLNNTYNQHCDITVKSFTTSSLIKNEDKGKAEEKVHLQAEMKCEKVSQKRANGWN